MCSDQDPSGEPVPEIPAYTISVDPHLSIETGANLTFASSTAIAALETRVFSFELRHPAATAPLRLLRALVLDEPVAYWFVTLEHEGFGHAGRARELGAATGVHLGSPWEHRRSYATFDPEGLSTEDLMRIYAGGAEANGFSASLIERDLVAGRSLHLFEIFYLLRSRLVTSQYVLLTTPDPARDPAGFYSEWAGGGDVAHYLGFLNTKYYGEPGITPTGAAPSVVREYQRLERQARWNALDPGTWIALWEAGRRIAFGDAARGFPLPSVRGRPYLPILSADWLPDGGVASLEVVLGEPPGAETERRFTSFTLRRGGGPGGAFGALGAASDRVLSSGALQIGGEIEAWTRPGRNPGLGARAHIVFARGAFKDVFVDLGAKSAGAWPGRPVGTGAFVRAGYAWSAGS